MKQPCTLTSYDCNSIKTQLISQLTGVSVPDADVHAASALLRTNVHPDAFLAVQKLGHIIGNDARRIRLIADRIGYSWISEQLPVTAPLIDAYQESPMRDFSATDITAYDLAECYMQIVSTIALYDEHLLTQLTAAALAVVAHDQLQNDVHAFRPTTAQPFMTRFGELSLRNLSAVLDQFLYTHQHAQYRIFTNSENPEVQQQVLQKSVPIEPVHVHIHEGGGVHTLRIPLALALHDTYKQHYSVVPVAEAQPVQQQAVQPLSYIPWDRAMKGGVTLSFTALSGISASVPVYYHLTPQTLEAIRQKGSAVHTIIGLHGDIRLYPEYGYVPLGIHHISEDPIASVRVSNAHVEVHALEPGTELTVFG